MNRYLVIFIVLLVIVAVAVGIVSFLHTSSSPPSQQENNPPVVVSSPPDVYAPVVPPSSQGNQSPEAVQAAFKSEIASYDNDHTKLHQTVIAGDYALQVWIGDTMGGEALLKYDVAQQRWIVITGGGGAWSIDGLVAAGVPRDTATTLLAGMPK